ncbi:MAG: hypothetical protein P4L53_03485 [Candidatus Obscuribacterales bacterium]|nr:hypothetical protein [Candidatus Obscuribacterales bacterium]
MLSTLQVKYNPNFRLVLCTLAGLTLIALSSAQAALADGSYTPSGSSMGDILKYQTGGHNVDALNEVNMIQIKKSDQTDPTCHYAAQPVGGAQAGNAQLDVTTPTPETTSQVAVPDQPIKGDSGWIHNPTGLTQYPNPLLNHIGPPKGAPPWSYTKQTAYRQGKGNNVPPNTFKNGPLLGQTPSSDLNDAIGAAVGGLRLGSQLNNPDFKQSVAQQQGQVQQAAEGANAAGTNQFMGNMAIVQTYLINVANENAGAPGGGSGPHTLPQAIGMVQAMYKNVYLPIALLLLLPGAVATQVMCVVHKAINHEGSEEISSPFTGIMRAMVAVFLIPGTQLIVSYSIDVGNSMTGAVTDNLQTAGITSWVNGITNPNPNQTQKQKIQAAEAQSTTGAMQDMVFGTISMLASDGLMILTQWQIVLACYLLLLGPIAACFFAWPAKVGKLFKPVFGNWLDALFNLVLWRFWWCVILLCMATRLQWLADIGEPTQGPWERLVFMAFEVMLTYVPFMALEFKPGSLVDQLMEKTKGSSGQQGSGTGKLGNSRNRGFNTKGSV